MYIKLFLSTLLMANIVYAKSNVECRFMGLKDDYTTKIDQSVPFDLESELASSGKIGPYNIEIMVYEDEFKVGIELRGMPINSIGIAKAIVTALPPGQTIFGWNTISHSPAQGYGHLRYECKKVD